MVRIKCINLYSIKSVIFTKLESSKSQGQTCIVYKIDTGADGNLIKFKIFKNLFLKLTIEQLSQNAVVIKTYNNSNTEKLGICTAKLQHTENVINCRFSVVPGNCPALLGDVDIEVLGIIRITCEAINSQQAGRKFDSQIE